MHTVTGMSQYDTSDTHLRNPVNTVDNPESPPARALVPNTGIPVLQSTITGRSRQIIPSKTRHFIVLYTWSISLVYHITDYY